MSFGSASAASAALAAAVAKSPSCSTPATTYPARPRGGFGRLQRGDLARDLHLAGALQERQMLVAVVQAGRPGALGIDADPGRDLVVHRQLSVPALARLIEAADFELTLGVRRRPGRLRRLPGPAGRRVHRGA
jgi:hypothetical protein